MKEEEEKEDDDNFSHDFCCLESISVSVGVVGCHGVLTSFM